MLHGPLALRDSIRVLKNLSSFQHEKRNSVSPRSHVMFYLLFKHQGNTKPFHLFIFFIIIFFFARGAIYHVARETVIFSLVKITYYFKML